METATGRTFNLQKWYVGIGSDFPTADQISQAKTSPTVTIEHFAMQTKNITGNASGVSPAGNIACTRNGKTYKTSGWTFKQINSGALDPWLRQVATKLNAMDVPVMLDFDHEIDGSYIAGSKVFTACSATAVANGTGFAYKDAKPQDYVTAYRHIHDLMSGIAPKIVWAQIYAGWPKTIDAYKQTYVGDNYVDWVGWDPYNHPDKPTDTSHTPAQTFTGAPFYKFLTATDPNSMISSGIAAKPRMLGEYGTNSYAKPNRQTWMTEIPAGMQAAGLDAVEYFDSGSWSKFMGDASATTGFATASKDSSVYANFTYQTAHVFHPQILTITPATGSTAGGSTVTIIVKDVPAGTPAVTFGGVAATHVSRVANVVTATAPAHAAGQISITVSNGGLSVDKGGFSYRTPVPHGIDLVITKISWSPANAKVDSPLTFSAIVKNQGDTAVPAGTPFGVNFAVNGSQVSWSTGFSNGLAAGASTTLVAGNGPNKRATWTLTAGSHTVSASVNNQGKVSEVNTSNNTFSTKL
jgi:hypothetical protein